MIERIKIEKLFGIYDYDIRLNAENAVTVITGPNGYGKTTILKIMYHLIRCDFWYFYLVFFSRIDVTFTGGKVITIKKTTIEDTEDNPAYERDGKVIFSISDGATFYLDKGYIHKLADNVFRQNEKYYPPKLRFKADYEDYLTCKYCFENDRLIDDKCHEFAMFLRHQECSYQQAQRLIHDEYDLASDSMTLDSLGKHEITRLPNDLKNRFLKAQEAFAVKSQEIDGTYFNRLVEAKKKGHEESEIKRKAEGIEKKIESYKKYGLVTENMKIVSDVEEGQRDNFSLYLEDMEQKLATLDDFYAQLSIFDNGVNGKCLSDKKMYLNRKDGIKVIFNDGRNVPLIKLSDGEQNLMILYYQLAFNTRRDSLLLVDEPEDSMHVAWVEKMLDDYKMIAEKLGCQIVIATHSPTFLDDDWDVSIDLYSNSVGEDG